MSTESLPGAIWTEDASAARPASAFVTMPVLGAPTNLTATAVTETTPTLGTPTNLTATAA